MKGRGTILVADDDAALRHVLRILLETEGFGVIEAAEGKECLKLAYAHRPDLVLLDIMLPDRDGRELCRRLREVSDVPIIMLTALSDEKEKIDRLNDGADDYVAKPFSNQELVARIRAVLRRNRQPSSSSPAYDDGYLKVDPRSRQVFVNGTEVAFSPKEWRVLECLISCKDQVVSREELLRFVWGNGYKAEFQYLKVFVSRIRGKLNDDSAKPRYIHTVHKVGYRFESHP